jgi:poly(3-hydroxybutyrate) depolymerase
MKFYRRLFVGLLVATALGGCGKNNSGAAGKSPEKVAIEEQAKKTEPPRVKKIRESIMVNGVERHYTLTIPATMMSSLGHPLFIGFHATGKESEGWLHEQTAFDPHIADRKLIIVYPETPQRRDWEHSESSSDVAFFDALLAHLRAKYPINDRKLYTFGHVNGASFAVYLLQLRHKDIAGAMAYAGLCPPISKYPKPRPMIVYSGDDDLLVNDSVMDVVGKWMAHRAVTNQIFLVHAPGNARKRWPDKDGATEKYMLSILLDR